MAHYAKNRRKRKNYLLGTLLLLGVIAVVAGIAYVMLTRDPDLDEVTLCPPSGPTAHTVLLVDKTDPLTFTQRTAFLVFLKEFHRGKIEKGELLSVFVLGEDYKATAEPIFQMCNPGTGENESIWTQNPARLHKRYVEKFEEPMTTLADQLAATSVAKFSPVFEMLQMAVINGFRKNAVRGPHHLVVVSDMLHNTPEYSQYKEAIDFDTFLATPLYPKVRTDFSGAEIELVYLMNNPPLQTRRHLKFWEDYFQNMRGRVVAVRPLEG